MEKVNFGLQTMTLLPLINKIGLFDALKKCTETGVYCFEVSQIPMVPKTIEVFQRAKKELGICVKAMSALTAPLPAEEFPYDIPFDNLEEHFDKIVSDCHALDCDMLRIGALPRRAVGSAEGAVAFAEEMDIMAKRLEDCGISLHFHTHHAEFSKYHGKTVLDIIRDHTEYLGFELDPYWSQVGGVNPVELIRRYRGRIRLLHLQDYRVNGKKCASEGWEADFLEGAEVGEGNLSLKECIEAGMESGCRFFVIEQDKFYGRSPMESIRINHANLVAMGYGDYFLPENQ